MKREVRRANRTLTPVRVLKQAIISIRFWPHQAGLRIKGAGCKMRLPILSTFIASIVGLLVAVFPVHAQDHEVLRGRLVFSDHERSVVRVLDLDTGKVTHTFRVPKPRASLATTDAHGDHRDVDATRRWEEIAAFDNACPEMHGHASRADPRLWV